MFIYTSRLSQGKRFVFIHKFANGECEEMHKGSFGFSEYPQGEQKNILKDEQERTLKELISGNDV